MKVKNLTIKLLITTILEHADHKLFSESIKQKVKSNYYLLITSSFIVIFGLFLTIIIDYGQSVRFIFNIRIITIRN